MLSEETSMGTGNRAKKASGSQGTDKPWASKMITKISRNVGNNVAGKFQRNNNMFHHRLRTTTTKTANTN